MESSFIMWVEERVERNTKKEREREREEGGEK